MARLSELKLQDRSKTVGGRRSNEIDKCNESDMNDSINLDDSFADHNSGSLEEESSPGFNPG